MWREWGRAPKGRTCGECIFCAFDEFEDEYACTNEKGPDFPFIIEPQCKACGLFKSEWRREREELETQGQGTIPFATYGTVKRACYDLRPGVELADQDWTTPGFWPRTVQ
jgi:hypothetical protein